jgi:hypothetical protein
MIHTITKGYLISSPLSMMEINGGAADQQARGDERSEIQTPQRRRRKIFRIIYRKEDHPDRITGLILKKKEKKEQSRRKSTS